MNRSMPADAPIDQFILQFVAGRGRITPIELKKILKKRLADRSGRVGDTLRQLVMAGQLAYTYEFGCSFLEINYNRPIQVSRRIVMVAAGMRAANPPDGIAIKIKSGAAFGSGRHATTRLALQALDWLTAHQNQPPLRSRFIDIGTGSGVLAMAVAGLLPRASGLAIDIDRCACAEAQANIAFNDLQQRIRVSSQPVASIDEQFDLLIANLRYPTLCHLMTHLDRWTHADSYLVLSGIRGDELDDLIKKGKNKAAHCVWRKCRHQWAAVVLQRHH